jgi:hypothetical protein
MDTTTSAPARQRKPRPKPQRSVRLTIKPEGASPGILHIRVGKESFDYFLTELPADFGRGFKVEKVGIDATEPPYHVNVNGGDKTCDCKGHLRHAHCKHADGIAALIAAGLL